MLIIFKMFNTRVHHLFDAEQFFGEELFHCIEAYIHRVKALIHVGSQIGQSRIVEQNSNEHRQAGNCDGQYGRYDLWVQRNLPTGWHPAHIHCNWNGG